MADATQYINFQYFWEVINGLKKSISPGGAGITIVPISEAALQALVGGLDPTVLYQITDADGGTAVIDIMAFDADTLQSVGWGSYQNAVMVSPVSCMMGYDLTIGKVLSVREEVMNNTVYTNDSVISFPFDNVSWVNNTLNGTLVQGLGGGGCVIKDSVLMGGTVNFDDHVDCLLDRVDAHHTTFTYTTNDGSLSIAVLGHGNSVTLGADGASDVTAKNQNNIDFTLGGVQVLTLGSSNSFTTLSTGSDRISLGNANTIILGGSCDTLEIGTGNTITLEASCTASVIGDNNTSSASIYIAESVIGCSNTFTNTASVQLLGCNIGSVNDITLDHNLWYCVIGNNKTFATVQAHTGCQWVDNTSSFEMTLDFLVTMDLTPIVGTLQVGDYLTGGTSGATAYVVTKNSNTITFEYTSINLGFTIGETITGSVSLATATVSTITYSAYWNESGYLSGVPDQQNIPNYIGIVNWESNALITGGINMHYIGIIGVEQDKMKRIFRGASTGIVTTSYDISSGNIYAGFVFPNVSQSNFFIFELMYRSSPPDPQYSYSLTYYNLL